MLIHSVHNSLHLANPKLPTQFFPIPLPLGDHKSVLCLQSLFLFHQSVKALVTQLCPTLCNSMDGSLPEENRVGILLGHGLGCHALLQGIFPTQGSNPGLLHCRQILYCLSYLGSSNRKHSVL